MLQMSFAPLTSNFLGVSRMNGTAAMPPHPILKGTFSIAMNYFRFHFRRAYHNPKEMSRLIIFKKLFNLLSHLVIIFAEFHEVFLHEIETINLGDFFCQFRIRIGGRKTLTVFLKYPNDNFFFGCHSNLSRCKYGFLTKNRILNNIIKVKPFICLGCYISIG